MTYQQHLMRQVFLIGLLLDYLPHCTSESQKDSILEEVRRMRRSISAIEEMTKTERHTKARMVRVIIESQIGYG